MIALYNAQPAAGIPAMHKIHDNIGSVENGLISLGNAALLDE